MKSLNECNTELIARYLAESMSGDEEMVLESHLDDCVVCQQLIKQAGGSDVEWSEAINSLRPNAFDLQQCNGGISPPLDIDVNAASDQRRPDAPAAVWMSAMLSPSDDPRMLGRIGSFEVSGCVGIGGMSVVFKARDPSLDRYVAVKVLAPQLALSPTARERFAREAKAAAAVVHDNVIAIHQVAQWQDLPYLVMPYLAGPSLQQRLDRDGPMDMTETLRVALQVAKGLAAAHSQGLVHRDIKPANILLCGDTERAILTDFGLARAADDASLTRVGALAGTPQYMAPEQARGESVDARSDLFSLGSIMFAMLAGHPPVGEQDGTETIQQVATSPPPKLRELRPDLPVWLGRLISLFHQYDARDRLSSSAEAARILSACLAYVQQPDTNSVPKELQPPLRRNSSVVAAIAGCVLMVVALAIACVFLSPTKPLDESLHAELHSGDPSRVVRAMGRIRIAERAEFYDDVSEVFAQSDNSWIRRTAVETLIRNNAPQARQLIREAITDPKAELQSRHAGAREWALRSVTMTKDNEFIFAAIRDALADDESYYRKWGAIVLASYPPAVREFQSRLPELANDSDPVIRYSLLGNLSPDPETEDIVAPLLVDAVKSNDPTNRIAGAASVKQFGAWFDEHPDVLGKLVEQLLIELDQQDVALAGAAASALLSLHHQDGVVRQIENSLRFGTPRQRAFAATILLDADVDNVPVDVQLLESSIDHGDEETQLRAVAALARRASLESVPLLQNALDNQYASVQRSAVFGLQAAGFVGEFREVATMPDGLPASTLVLNESRTVEEQNRFVAATVALHVAARNPELSRLANNALIRIGATDFDPSASLIDYNRWKRDADSRTARRLTLRVEHPTNHTRLGESSYYIGTHKQLFIDDAIVAEMKGVERFAHPFQKHTGNPIFRAVAPWEENWADNFRCSVHYDEQTRDFKLWYRCGARASLAAIAVSDDGLAWQRPNLGYVEYNGSRENNLIGWRTELHRDAQHPGHSVIVQSDAEPSERYLSFLKHSGDRRGFYTSYSADGIRWSKPEFALSIMGNAATLLPDQARGGYQLFFKQPLACDGQRRSFGFALLNNIRANVKQDYPFIARTNQHDALVGSAAARSFGVIAPDTLNSSNHGTLAGWHTQIYSLAPLIYEGHTLVFCNLWYATGKRDGPLEIMMMASRDLSEWYDVGYPQPILPRGRAGEWDAGMVLGGSNILVVDDEIRMYYTGCSKSHDTATPYYSRPEYVQGVGVATLRLDGFVSLRANDEVGTITTKPVKIAGNRLQINASATAGSIRVALLDESGKAIEGYSATDCDAFREDDLRHVVAWNGSSDVSQLADRELRIVFEITKADLYAFQFVKE